MNFHTPLITVAVTIVFAIIFSIITSFASLFGLDFLTAVDVCVWLFITSVITFGLFKFTSLSWKIIPAFLAFCFLSFRPAFKFWAYGAENSFHYNYMIGRDAPWYANNWIQFGIVLAILVIGYFLIWMMFD